MGIVELKNTVDEDVTAALQDAWASLPIPATTEVLALYSRFLDLLTEKTPQDVAL